MEQIKEGLASLHGRIGKLLTELAVNEEKLNNKVSKENLQKEFRSFEEKTNSKIKEEIKVLHDMIQGISDKLTALRVGTAKDATKVALVTSLITTIISGIIVGVIVYYATKN